MLIPNRHGNSPAYRYGFQGQEKDDEIKGESNSYNFGERLLDTRIGRWLSTDNIDKPWLSPYQFASNNPINNIDPDGNDEIHFHYNTQKFYGKDGKTYTELYISAEIIKNNLEHTFFMHSPSGEIVQFHPFQSNRLPNQSSFVAHNNELPMSKGISWFFGMLNSPIDDYAYLGRLLQTAPNIINHYNGAKDGTGMRLKGSVNMAGSVEFTEKLIDASETVYAIVDGYYLFKGFSKFVVKEYAKTNLKLATSNLEFSSKMSKVGATGEIGESYLKGLGGTPQVHFATEVGKGGRFVDQFVSGVAYESKTGYTSLTKDIKMQIAKDAELLNSKTSGVKKVVWTFFESPITGKAGASKPLQEALKKAGIETQIIR